MSIDELVTTDIIETLEDGSKGFALASEKLAETKWSHLAPKFAEYGAQRATFSAELEKMAASYGDDIDEDGSVGAALHRGWMTLKDAISGSDPEGVLDAALQGENHAVEEYEEALNKDISAGLRTVLERQFGEVKRVHAEVEALQTAAA